MDIAVSLFNDGKVAILEIMEGMEITPGLNAKLYCMKSDNERLKLAEKRVLSYSRAARIAKRRKENKCMKRMLPKRDLYIRLENFKLFIKYLFTKKFFVPQ